MNEKNFDNKNTEIYGNLSPHERKRTLLQDKFENN